jgi:hypothetical protein
VQEFAKLHPEHIAEENSLAFLVDDTSKGIDGDYNLCHCEWPSLSTSHSVDRDTHELIRGFSCSLVVRLSSLSGLV